MQHSVPKRKEDREIGLEAAAVEGNSLQQPLPEHKENREVVLEATRMQEKGKS